MTPFFSIGTFHLSRPLVKLLAVCNATVLLVNLFVGLLVYQNPFMPLMDLKNSLYVFLAGTSLAIGLFTLYRLVLFAENNWHGKGHLHRTSTIASLLVLFIALTALFTLA